eukprot:440203-Rhodomonas_salina.2
MYSSRAPGPDGSDFFPTTTLLSFRIIRYRLVLPCISMREIVPSRLCARRRLRQSRTDTGSRTHAHSGDSTRLRSWCCGSAR